MRLHHALTLIALLDSCSGKKDEVPPPPETAAPASETVVEEPAPVTEATLDMASGAEARLDGGIHIHALAGSVPASATAHVQRLPEDALVGLPHTGAAARIGPVLNIELPRNTTLPLVVAMPVDPEKIPGGLQVPNAHGAMVVGEQWAELPALLSGEGDSTEIVMLVSTSARVSVLADAVHSTPDLGLHARTLLVAAPLLFGPRFGPPQVPAHEQGMDGEPDPLYVLSGVQSTITLGGREYRIMETKERNRDGSPRLVAIERESGGFVSEPETVRDVLLARALKTRLQQVDRQGLATVLEDNARTLATSQGASPIDARLQGLVDEATAEDLALPSGVKSVSSTLDSWLETFRSQNEPEKMGPMLLTLERHRTRLVLMGLRDRLLALDPETGDGDLLLELYADLSWVISRCQVVKTVDGETLAPSSTMASTWHDGSAITASLAPADQKKKSGEWIDMEDILAQASEISHRPAVMAPPPETEITKSTFSKGRLTVKVKGTDEDGKVTGYRWWFDEGKDPHVIKGKGLIRTSLSELRSGSHDLYVAALDDDDQQDPSADRLSFHVRRSVDVDTRNLDIVFDAHPWNINSEHTRSIKLFVRRLEGPVVECANDHYRWGIDGGGKVTMSFSFSADKTANVAHSATIDKDTFKNKKMARCIEKAAKKPRMRYNQDYRPAARVTVTFHLKPTILYFDAETLGSVPGPDVMGAALYLKCTARAARKVETWCDGAVKDLPGPWDAEQQLIDAGLLVPENAASGDEEQGPAAPSDEEDDEGEATGDLLEETGEEGDPDPPDEEQEENPAEEEEEEEEVLDMEDLEGLVIPHPEFDAIAIHADCVEDNVSIFLENCMLHLTKKRLWCVDSCMKLARQCAKQCDDDHYMCQETCWRDDALSCAEHCTVKGTLFEKESSAAEW